MDSRKRTQLISNLAKRICNRFDDADVADLQWVIRQLDEAFNEFQNTQKDQDICGFCGLPGADKIPHPEHWPGERTAETELVHSECEREETQRAHSNLSDEQRREFLRLIATR